MTYGGWAGHDPAGCAAWCSAFLRARGFVVDLTDTLDPLTDPGYAAGLDLVVPVWSLADAPAAPLDALVGAVSAGVGLAAFHGAAAAFDAHRGYRRMLGGSFVWHPEEREFVVDCAGGDSFRIFTEQYHLHVDPANEMVARTRLCDGTVMPVAWRRRHGRGRVFYTALGHSRDVLDAPAVRGLFGLGVDWACRRGGDCEVGPEGE